MIIIPAGNKTFIVTGRSNEDELECAYQMWKAGLHPFAMGRGGEDHVEGCGRKLRRVKKGNRKRSQRRRRALKGLCVGED